MYEIRSPVLDLSEKVYITKEAKNMLRKIKQNKKQSMAQIVIDLIKKEYETTNKP